MENGYNLSDIAAVSGGMGGLGAGGGGAWVLIILFAMIFGNGGFGGWGNGAAALTQGDLQRAIDLNSIQDGQRDIEARVQEIGAENISAIKDAAYNNLSEIRDIGATVNAGFAAQQRCCCETLRAIDGVNYNGAINTASINANTTAQTQKILDALAQNKIESLQGRINQLEMQNALGNVVRYPTMMAYNAGASPFCGGYTPCGGNANY